MTKPRDRLSNIIHICENYQNELLTSDEAMRQIIEELTKPDWIFNQQTKEWERYTA